MRTCLYRWVEEVVVILLVVVSSKMVAGNCVGMETVHVARLLLPRLTSSLPSSEMMEELLGLKGDLW